MSIQVIKNDITWIFLVQINQESVLSTMKHCDWSKMFIIGTGERTRNNPCKRVKEGCKIDSKMQGSSKTICVCEYLGMVNFVYVKDLVFTLLNVFWR